VGPPDGSGYHPVRTLLCPLTFGDSLTFERVSSGVELISEYPGFPIDESNLIWRAYRALGALNPGMGGIRVVVDKRIPIGGGLGGGSSNAAAALTAVDELYGLGLSLDAKLRLAATIGADVPFFVLRRAVFASGYGEIVTPVSGPGGIWTVVAWSGEPVSTRWVYESYDRYLKGTTPARRFFWGKILNAWQGGKLEQIASVVSNQLETVVLEKRPEIATLKELMLASGALCALLCGSGESVFALVDTEEKGENLKKELLDRGYQCNLCQVVNHVNIMALS